MAAAVRGGGATSRSTAQTRPRAGRPRAKASNTYAPAKLAAARSLGLMPLTALSVAVVIGAGGVVAMLASDPRVERAREQTVAALDQAFIDLGFKVSDVTVQGATPAAAGDVLKAAALVKGEPILHLDLKAVRGRVEGVGWVKSAKVVRLLPDTIVIAITERQTLAVWQHAGRTLVIDSTGRTIPEADPAQFADLPLVVGEGADQAAPGILPLLESRPRLMGKLDAVVRVDDRRWDLRTRDGALIQLPADGEAQALMRLDSLDAQSRVLDLGFTRIDLRDPDLVAVRPSDAPSTPQPVTAAA
jgi:cell division protein FtsQ